MALNLWHVTRRRIAKGALMTVYNWKTPNSPLCIVAADSIDLDEANLRTESHKALRFPILDLKQRYETHIGVCQKYIEAYGPQRLLFKVLRASV